MAVDGVFGTVRWMEAGLWAEGNGRQWSCEACALTRRGLGEWVGCESEGGALLSSRFGFFLLLFPRRRSVHDGPFRNRTPTNFLAGEGLRS